MGNVVWPVIKVFRRVLHYHASRGSRISRWGGSPKKTMRQSIISTILLNCMKLKRILDQGAYVYSAPWICQCMHLCYMSWGKVTHRPKPVYSFSSCQPKISISPSLTPKSNSIHTVDPDTKSSNYMKIWLKALNYFELQQTLKYQFELEALRIKPQLNSPQIGGTSN